MPYLGHKQHHHFTVWRHASTFDVEQQKPTKLHGFISRIFEQQSLIEFLRTLENSGMTIEWVVKPDK